MYLYLNIVLFIIFRRFRSYLEIRKMNHFIYHFLILNQELNLMNLICRLNLSFSFFFLLFFTRFNFDLIKDGIT